MRYGEKRIGHKSSVTRGESGISLAFLEESSVPPAVAVDPIELDGVGFIRDRCRESPIGDGRENWVNSASSCEVSCKMGH